MYGPFNKNRLKVATTTTGTGTLTLGSAQTGFQTFAAGDDGKSFLFTVYEVDANGNPSGAWETSVGAYTHSGTTLARTTLVDSSTGSAINFGAGTKHVIVGPVGDFATWNVFLPKLTPPKDADFSWFNQGSATVATINGGITLAAPSNGGYNIRGREIATPSPPYKIDTMFTYQVGWTSANDCMFGMFWRESGSGKISFAAIDMNISAVALAVLMIHYKWNSPSSYNSSYYGLYGTFPQFVFMRMEDDNTNRKIHFSDNGKDWILAHTVGRTDFITPDKIGFGVNPYTGPCQMNLWHWLAS